MSFYFITFTFLNVYCIVKIPLYGGLFIRATGGARFRTGKEAMDPRTKAELAPQPALAMKAIRLAKTIRELRKKHGLTSSLDIYCGGGEPKFRFVSTLVYAHDGRRVTYRKLSVDDLRAICDQLAAYIQSITQ